VGSRTAVAYNESKPREKNRMPTDKPPTSYRLSEKARGLIDRLAGALGLSRTAIVEMAIRQLARRELGDATFSSRSTTTQKKSLGPSRRRHSR
jgi:hypothetical protein